MSPIRTLDPMLPLGDSRSCSRRPTRVLPCPQGTLTGKLDPMACGELPRYAEDLKHSLLQAGERSLRSEVNHICTVQKLNDFMRPREATLPEERRLFNGPSCVRLAHARGTPSTVASVLSHRHAGVGFTKMSTMPLIFCK